MMPDNPGDESEFDDLVEAAIKNHRPHAGHFSWETNKEIAEAGVLKEFQYSLAKENRLFFQSAIHRGQGNDPPDCEATNQEGKAIGIEISELVDSKSAAAARAGAHYEWKDWKGALIPELQRLIGKKDAPSNLKGGPYSEYVLVIFSDEPWLEYDYVEEALANHFFKTPKLITRAFLLLSYSPFIKSYPCYEILFNT